MRLRAILEAGEHVGRHVGDERVGQFKDVLGFMPGRKIKHSLRVGDTAARAGLPAHGVEAAVLHDYIERGGKLSQLLPLNLNQRTLSIIRMLSIDEKSPGADDTADVQQHVEQMLADKSLDPHDRDVAIIVKCADRIDNLKKRVKEGRLTPGYREASMKLFQTLTNSYRGDPDILRHIKSKIGKISDATRPKAAVKPLWPIDE